MSEERDLVVLGEVERLLASATTVEDFKVVITLAETARKMAQKAHLGLRAQNRAVYWSLEAQAKADAALKEARERGDLATQGSNQNSATTSIVPTLADIGVTWNEAAAWAKVASVPPERRAAYVDEAAQAGEEASRAGLLRWRPGTGLMSSDSPEWYTPPHVIEAVVAALGAIDLDPCADPGRSVPAARHYTVDDDGLAQPWRGRVYMNPPYGSAIVPWCARLSEEYVAGNVTAAIALVPARTDTDWWAQLGAESLCLVHGRLAFSGHATPAPFPSACVYLGPNADSFTAAFAGLGEIYRRVA